MTLLLAVMDGWMDGWKMDMWVDKGMSIWKAQEEERSSNNWRVWGSNPSSCSLHLEKSLGKTQNPNLLQVALPSVCEFELMVFPFLSWCLTLLSFQSPLPCLFLTTVIALSNRICIVLLVFQCFRSTVNSQMTTWIKMIKMEFAWDNSEDYKYFEVVKIHFNLAQHL